MNEQTSIRNAIEYVTAVKKRLKGTARYESFLKILHSFQTKTWGIIQILDEVSTLFADHPDLLAKFTHFLPDNTIQKSPTIARRLLIAHPLAIKVANNGGRTPLEEFFGSWEAGLREYLGSLSRESDEIDWDVEIASGGGSNSGDVKTLREIYDMTLLFLQAYLHGSIENIPPMSRFEAIEACITVNSCTSSYLYMMIKLHPEMIYQRDDVGDYLIHKVILTSSSSDDDKILSILDDLISLKPEITSLSNHCSRLPFNLSIEQGKRSETAMINRVFKSTPMALTTRDVTSHMYPFMMAAVDESGETKNKLRSASKVMLNLFKICFEVLIQDPTLVKMGIPNTGVKRKRKHKTR